MTEEEKLQEEMWEESKPYGRGPLIDLKVLASHGEHGEKVEECLREFPRALNEIERLQELVDVAVQAERDAIIGSLAHHMNHNTKYGDEVNLINHLIGKIKNRNTQK